MIVFKIPHSKKFVSDRQAGLAWPGLVGLVDFVVVLVVHPLIIVLQFLMHVQLAQSVRLGFHHYQLASCIHNMYVRKNTLATFSWPFYNNHCIIAINKAHQPIKT